MEGLIETYQVLLEISNRMMPQHGTKFPSRLPQIEKRVRTQSIIKMKYCELLKHFEVFANQGVLVLTNVISVK